MDNNFKNIKLKISVLFFSIVVLVSFLMPWLEPNTFDSSFESIWWLLATLTTVGYGDIYPTTMLGKILGMIMMISGVGFFALIITELTKNVMNKISEREHGLKEFDGQDHVIICCDKSEIIRQIVDEYREDYGGEIEDFVVVSQKDESPIRNLDYSKLHWINGKPQEVDVLEKANPKEAKIGHVYLEDDSKAILCCLQLENVSDGNIVTAVKYEEEENTPHLKSAGADYLFNPTEIEIPLIVSALEETGSIEWTKNLISKAKTSPNLYNVDVTEEDAGSHWSEIVKRYLQEEMVHPVAIVKKSDKIIHNPEPDHTVNSKDSLLVISNSKP